MRHQSYDSACIYNSIYIQILECSLLSDVIGGYFSDNEFGMRAKQWNDSSPATRGFSCCTYPLCHKAHRHAPALHKYFYVYIGHTSLSESLLGISVRDGGSMQIVCVYVCVCVSLSRNF